MKLKKIISGFCYIFSWFNQMSFIKSNDVLILQEGAPLFNNL